MKDKMKMRRTAHKQKLVTRPIVSEIKEMMKVKVTRLSGICICTQAPSISHYWQENMMTVNHSTRKKIVPVKCHVYMWQRQWQLSHCDHRLQYHCRFHLHQTLCATGLPGGSRSVAVSVALLPTSGFLLWTQFGNQLGLATTPHSCALYSCLCF